MAKDNLETFINDLYSSADEYSKMLEPLKKEIPKVEITDLYRLANFCNITQIRPIILALINWCKIKKISDYKDIASFLENLLNCGFKLMAIGNISPSKIENGMFKIVESIIKDGKFDKEFEDGKKDFPIISEDEIRIFLNKTLSTSNKKYILYKYLVKVGTTSETKIRKEIELEHILPQKPQKGMNTIEGKNTNIDEVTRLKNLLGNNIFIIDKKNKKLSNQIGSKKKEYIFGNSKTLFGIIDKTIIDGESKENILPTDIDEQNKRLIDIIINEKII